MNRRSLSAIVHGSSSISLADATSLAGSWRAFSDEEICGQTKLELCAKR